MNKKALTPLFSTILLIVFAIGLGTLVMSWGAGETSHKENCPDIELAVSTLSGSSQLCFEGTTLVGVLENNGQKDITSLELVSLTEDSVTSETFSERIPSGNFKRIRFSLESQPLKIRLIPHSQEACVDKRIELENIGTCQ